MNIAIMRAFVEVRKALMMHSDIKEQLREIKERINRHDSQLSSIYDAIEICWMKKLRKESGTNGSA